MTDPDVTVGPGAEADLPAIAAILNEAIVNSALYRALLRELAAEPVHVALAGIVLPNEPSVALHRKLGFREVGVFHEYATKNGQYLSSVWMELRLPGRQTGQEPR
jgi:L-amino acid N-acyltransferase YncA